MTGNLERRTWAAAFVNLFAMAVEIGGGSMLGSAALLAEGYHMGAHVAAMLVAALGYRLSGAVRLRRGDEAARRTIEGAGVLNALILVAIAGLLLMESVARVIRPEPISFLPAATLALFGLLVNLISLALLHHPNDREHGRHSDLSFRAVYLHMIGDAGVGVLSIAGLCLVAGLRWSWADGAAGVCGSVLIVGLASQILAALWDARRSRKSQAQTAVEATPRD